MKFRLRWVCVYMICDVLLGELWDCRKCLRIYCKLYIVNIVVWKMQTLPLRHINDGATLSFESWWVFFFVDNSLRSNHRREHQWTTLCCSKINDFDFYYLSAQIKCMALLWNGRKMEFFFAISRMEDCVWGRGRSESETESEVKTANRRNALNFVDYTEPINSVWWDE